MKGWLTIVFSLFIKLAFAQDGLLNYNRIDQYCMKIDAPTPAELANKITAPFTNNIEKARAIFSWIGQHISYGSRTIKQNNKIKLAIAESYPDDTGSVLKPVDELVSEDVLKNRVALCYGYSRLFKCLCEHAGIPCIIINGYARGDIDKVGRNFRTNHSWNAVYVDSSWHLVDVTWASGFFSYNGTEFIKHFDDVYFFTRPEQFAMDHFPDDLKWSLLQEPPTLGEFSYGPYKARCFNKYEIISYRPAQGVIRAALGDTINLSVQTELAPERNIGGGSLDDTTAFSYLPTAVYCKPTTVDNNKIIHYSYVVQSVDTQWLQLVYNDDMILRYKLEVKNSKN